MPERAIGVFDSGIGGLTVLREISKLLPQENLVYLGDTARVPYGSKSAETVRRYAIQNIDFLLTKYVKFLVVACNTASAYALELIREHYDVPVIGVIDPGAKAAVRASANKKIGVIGTRATIGSGAYEKIIHSLDSTAEIFAKPCPLFVSLAEEAMFEGGITDKVVEFYLKEIKECEVDTLILGCTHYPLLKKSIANYMGKNVTLLDSSIETASEVKRILIERNLLKKSFEGPGTCDLFVTDDSEHFRGAAHLFTGNGIVKLQKIDLYKEEK
ncbi:MAG: glutamate racemase [Candidatus Schekmanbacteria bacterium]|nr:glutamate racemase [Candidatus Schekmanbacteria bacterium]